jgi:hypothetical protein
MIHNLTIAWRVLLGVIFFVGFWHSYRAGRVTVFTICFLWFGPLLLSAAGISYSKHLSDADRAALVKAMPDGFNITGILTMGWFNGLVVSLLAVGMRKAIRKEPLFMPREDSTTGKK